MKLRLSELNSNPFKKDINSGKLNPEIVDKIKSNIKELGLMGALPVFKRDNKYYLIAGHHRTEALKQTFGKDFQVEVTVHDYSDDQILRGMVVENLTQRSDELVEVTENLNLIRKHLKANSAVEMARDKYHQGERYQAGVKDIYSWLNKNGYEVMSIGKISTYLSIADNLDRSLLKKVVVSEGGQVEEKSLSVTDASLLSRVDKKDQKALNKIFQDEDLNREDKTRLVNILKDSDEETKDAILSGEIGVQDIQKPEISSTGLDNTEMSVRFNKRSLELISEMRTLRKALYQFRSEKLFDAFTPRQRRQFYDKLTTIKEEYSNLMKELDTSLEVLR